MKRRGKDNSEKEHNQAEKIGKLHKIVCKLQTLILTMDDFRHLTYENLGILKVIVFELNSMLQNLMLKPL